jgi:hypothetical protein
MMKRRTVFLAFIALLSLLLLSCNLTRCRERKDKENTETAAPTPTTTASAWTPPTATATTVAGAQTPPTATATTAARAQTSPTATAVAQPPSDQAAGPVEMDDLNALQTYRADWTTRIQMPGQDGAMALSYKLEWVKDPPAQHVWMEMAFNPFSEVIWVGDKVWVKAGDKWVVGNDESTKNAFKNFHDAMDTDDEMTLVGSDTINGVQAKHYTYDLSGPNQKVKIHREIWVADQSGLPKVPIRALFRMENVSSQGTLVTETEANLYDINTPIEIKPPV